MQLFAVVLQCSVVSCGKNIGGLPRLLPDSRSDHEHVQCPPRWQEWQRCNITELLNPAPARKTPHGVAACSRARRSLRSGEKSGSKQRCTCVCKYLQFLLPQLHRILPPPPALQSCGEHSAPSRPSIPTPARSGTAKGIREVNVGGFAGFRRMPRPSPNGPKHLAPI